MRHPFIFYLLSFTWGLPMSLAGGVWCLLLLLIGRRPKRFGRCLRFEIGQHWGGANLGWLIVTCRDPSFRLLCHEHGHAYQNILLGPLMPLLVCLPSTLRFHSRNLLRKLRPQIRLKDYDSIWFEGWATALGETYCRDFH